MGLGFRVLTWTSKNLPFFRAPDDGFHMYLRFLIMISLHKSLKRVGSLGSR